MFCRFLTPRLVSFSISRSTFLVALNAPSTRNPTRLCKSSNSGGKPFSQFRFIRWRPLETCSNSTRPFLSHIISSSDESACHEFVGTHSTSHCSRVPENSEISPHTPVHVCATPFVSTEHSRCSACNARTSTSQLESNESHSAGARSPQTGGCQSVCAKANLEWSRDGRSTSSTRGEKLMLRVRVEARCGDMRINTHVCF